MVEDEGEEGDEQREREMLEMGGHDNGRRKGGQVNFQKCLSLHFLFVTPLASRARSITFF